MIETPPVPTGKSKRGRETVVDMLRSLALVFLVVLPLWFFGQSSPEDSKRIRPVDPRPALAAFAQDTRAPVPSTPDGWVANVSVYDAGVVRVGYVLGEHYTEFAGGVGTSFLEAAAGKGSVVGTLDVAGVAWRRWLSQDGHESLLRELPGVTLVVGGVRESVSLQELQLLAATVS